MLRVRALQVNFGLQEILKNIDFGLNVGEVVTITGANGAGKSTLLKCIAGLLTPTSGEIQMQKGVDVGYLSQATPSGHQTVMEFLLSDFSRIYQSYKTMKDSVEETLEYAHSLTEYMEAGGYELEAKIHRLLLSFGFTETDLQRELQSFSEGQKQLFSLLRLLLSEAQLLILDEPTNHLDISMCLYLEEVICREKRKGRAFVVVSHDRVFVDRVSDRTLYIQRGHSILVHGGYSQVIAHLEQDFLSRQQQAQDIQDKIKQLEQEARRKKVWSGRKEKEKIGAVDKGFIGAKAAKLAKRAKIAERKQLQMLEQLQAEKPFVEKKLNLAFTDYTVTQRQLLTAENLTKWFGNHTIFNNISLELTTQDRIALIGANGSGKTTLLQCLLGHIQPDSGAVNRNDFVNWLYLPQNIPDYFKSEILLDNLMVYGVEESIVRQFLGAAKLQRDRVLQPVATLSHGELMRAAIVSAILAKAEFLFLDEPTNHLDIESLEVLEDLLANFPGGILFISHDRQFITKNAQTILTVENANLQRVTWN